MPLSLSDSRVRFDDGAERSSEEHSRESTFEDANLEHIYFHLFLSSKSIYSTDSHSQYFTRRRSIARFNITWNSTRRIPSLPLRSYSSLLSLSISCASSTSSSRCSCSTKGANICLNCSSEYIPPSRSSSSSSSRTPGGS